MCPSLAGTTALPVVSGGRFCSVRGCSIVGSGSKIDIEELAKIFAVGVGGFSVMDNHLHLLVRLDPEVAADWSDDEVVRRWGRLYPPRDKSRKALPVSEEWVQDRLKDSPWVAKTRERLQSISWFMKCLKEPISRRANREDKCRGAFFEARFKSVAVLDEGALLATSTYIDLNPVAAKIAEVPETSEHTSIKRRVDHIKAEDEDSTARSGQSRQRGGFASGRRPGRGAVALPDRGSTPVGLNTAGHVRGAVDRQLSPPGGLHGPALSRGQGHDISRAGRHSRSDWEYCRELAGPDGEAQERPIVRPFLRGQPG